MTVFYYIKLSNLYDSFIKKLKMIVLIFKMKVIRSKIMCLCVIQ